MSGGRGRRGRHGRLWAALLLGTWVALAGAGVRAAPAEVASLPAEAAWQPPPGGQTEFVPLAELPPEEQLPAAPLLVIAYAVAWIAVVGYVWSLWRRLGRVQAELAAVRREVAREAQR